MKKIYILCFMSLLSVVAIAQVNGFAKVTSISGNTLNVTSVNEVNDQFAINENVIIMQMQDDVIGSNTGNNSSFGDLSAIASAGSYEIRKVGSIVETDGTPTQIVLSTSLNNTYSTGANSSVQVLTFPVLGGGGDFTTNRDIVAMDWNGYTGGITAFEVEGTLTLQHDIIADGAGFNGGNGDQTYSGSCDVNTYRYSDLASGTDQYATKGEGIYKISNNDYRDGRGKILNGGGGGNEHNGGGGGGGNYTAGGDGGPGWYCGSGNAGGLGGIALNSDISASRIFLGGGGGGGEGNNSEATEGGAGGGIILIKAEKLETQGSCGGHRISSNGDDVLKSGQDGSGGGGAGGSIIIESPSFDISSNCDLTIEANGGDGGNVDHWDTHGGGGGGGQGVVIFSISVPSNVTVNTNNGTGGCNNNSDPCNSQASSGSGSNGSGMISNSSGPLPIELLSFQAIPVHNKTQITWTTATELNNDFFTIERSKDGIDWTIVKEVDGAGDSHTTLFYQTVDEQPIAGISYYRLKQTDFDGASTYSDIRSVFFANGTVEISLHPNPATVQVNISSNVPLRNGVIKMHNAVGQVVPVEIIYNGHDAQINTAKLHPGPYFIRVEMEHEILKRKVIVE